MKLLVEITPLQAAEYLENSTYTANEVYVDKGSQLIELQRTNLCFEDFHKQKYFVRTEINIDTFDKFNKALHNLSTMLGGEQR